MNIISIDPGKRSLGYCIKKGKEVKTGSIRAKVSSPFQVAYPRLFLELTRLKEENDIDIWFIENYAFSKFGKSSSVSHLAEVTGIVKCVTGIEPSARHVIMVAPQSWNVVLGIRLPKKKDKVYLGVVNKHYKKQFKNCDEADAYLIMLAMYWISLGIVKTEGNMKLLEKMKAIPGLWE